MARRAKADADRAEYEAEAARRKLMVDEGRYVVAEDAARAWTRELTKLISDVETFLSTTLARAPRREVRAGLESIDGRDAPKIPRSSAAGSATMRAPGARRSRPRMLPLRDSA